MYRFNDTMTYSADGVQVVKYQPKVPYIVLLMDLVSHTFTSTEPAKSGLITEASMTGTEIGSGLAEFFAQDHRDCDARWDDVEELLDTEDIEAARPAWQRYLGGMRRHIAMEEEVLFPAFEAASGAQEGGPTDVMRMEHRQIRNLLGEIDAAMDAGDHERALEVGDTLLMMLQSHSAKEEKVLYPMAENLLSGQWQELENRLAQYTPDWN
jgi:hemerythrin-like domain-containing protein